MAILLSSPSGIISYSGDVRYLPDGQGRSGLPWQCRSQLARVDGVCRSVSSARVRSAGARHPSPISGGEILVRRQYAVVGWSATRTELTFHGRIGTEKSA
jgi:hypothetical protein